MTSSIPTPTNMSVRKVTVGALSGALVTLSVLVLNNYTSFLKRSL
jgi:hypothetical protein